jgi:protein ImuB
MRDAKAFLKLLTLDLEAHPPPAPVTAVSLAFEPVNPRVVQHGLFLPPAPEPQKLELTLARIAKLVGEGNAGSPELLDTHRPGAFRMKRFTVAPSGGVERRVEGRLALRVFRPALRARVEAHGGRPAQVEARGVRGRVVELAGPWRTSGDWWRGNAWSRDDWDVALSDGALYRLWRDRQAGEWFLEGRYD